MSNRKQCFTLSLQVLSDKNLYRYSNHMPKILQLTRGFFSFGSGKSFNKRREYTATKLVGYSAEQMFTIVSDVGNYKNFLPFCKKSDVIFKQKDFLKGNLEIGFPPLIEAYTSHVTLKSNECVKAVCKDSRLFDHLVTVWHFGPAIKDAPNTSIVTFYLSFQFKSLLYSQMANMIFNELVYKMENSFLKEARRRYGKATLATQTLTTTKS